jgi:hypothetical protein
MVCASTPRVVRIMRGACSSYSRTPATVHVFVLLRLIHIRRAAPLPFSDSAVSFVRIRVVAGNIRTDSPTVKRISMLLVTNFLELRVVARRSRTLAGRPHTVSGRPLLIHTCHTALCRDLDKSLSVRHGHGMAWALHGTCKLNTAALCKSNGKYTI